LSPSQFKTHQKLDTLGQSIRHTKAQWSQIYREMYQVSITTVIEDALTPYNASPTIR